MDTPVNVQVVPQQVLRDQQVITLGQALRNVSGVNPTSGSVSGFGTPSGRIKIRGFDVSTIYRDGFRIDTSQRFTDFIGFTQFANVASIEVLKGPGAVLYGISEPGGVVNIITKEPRNTRYYSVQQQFGSFALYRTTLDATGPVTEDRSWLYRINTSYETNGVPFGYPIDFVNSQNIFLAPVIKWNLDEATWVKLNAEFAQNRADAFFQEVPVLNGGFFPVPRSRNYNEPSPELQTWLFAALTWSHRFDADWVIKQQIAYNRIDLSDMQTFVDIFGAIDTPTGPTFLRNLQHLSNPQTIYFMNVDITGYFDTF